MILYSNPEKERFLEDYIPLPSLRGLYVFDLEILLDNLEKTIESAWEYNSELLEIALSMDIEKTKLYIKMACMKQEKQQIKDNK